MIHSDDYAPRFFDDSRSDQIRFYYLGENDEVIFITNAPSSYYLGENDVFLLQMLLAVIIWGKMTKSFLLQMLLAVIGPRGVQKKCPRAEFRCEFSSEF